VSSKAYTTVTSKIIEALKQGIVPWRRPWKSSDQPMSLATGKPYHGINVFILLLTAMSEGYRSQYWATFNQIKARGGHVKGGEHGTQVVLWKRIEIKEKNAETGKTEKKTIPMLRTFTVFNLDQTEGVKDPTATSDREHSPIEAADLIADGYIGNGGPTLTFGGPQAYYSPPADSVTVPYPEDFTRDEGFYSVLFHELAHSTGHESRLDRIKSTKFGSGDYSREELIAEMTSCFLLSEAEVDVDYTNSAAYINSWIQALTDDEKALVVAAGAAQKAADLILSASQVEAEEEAMVAA
jgi:antirestriction protein ArdC